MTFRDVILYFGAAVASKFVKDNLPDLHYKKVLKAAGRAALICYALCWYLLVRLGIRKLSQKEQIMILAVALIAIAIQWLDNQKNKQPVSTTGA